MAHILHLFLEQVALLGLQADTRDAQRREDLPEVFHVFRRRLREDNDVVKVHEAALPLESPEHHVDGPSKGLRGIGQTEVKADVGIGPLVANESRLVPDLVRQGDLPIPRVAVKRRKHLGVPEEVNTIVHTWQRVHVPYRYLVKSAVIHADRIVPSGFGTRTTGKAHSALEGSITRRSHWRCTSLAMMSLEAWLTR